MLLNLCLDCRWGLPGGNVDPTDGDLFSTAEREGREEMGHLPQEMIVTGKITTLRGSKKDKQYTVFSIQVSEDEQIKFVPTLNEEHTSWKWFSMSELDQMKNLHPVVEILLEEHRTELEKSLVSVPASLVY